MSLLKDIINLGEKLPEKDRPHFEKFIKERNFDDALDLVNSVIILSEKAEDYDHNQIYLHLDKESILLLQTYLMKYLDQLYFEYESNINKND